MAFSIEERRNLAQYCSQNPDDCVAFEKLCTAIRPMAYAVMKLHKNVIPYYDKEDYLQEAYITLFRVLKRLAVKPDIINSFSAYLCTAIKIHIVVCFAIMYYIISLRFDHTIVKKMGLHIHRRYISKSTQIYII